MLNRLDMNMNNNRQLDNLCVYETINTIFGRVIPCESVDEFVKFQVLIWRIAKVGRAERFALRLLRVLYLCTRRTALAPASARLRSTDAQVLRFLASNVH